MTDQISGLAYKALLTLDLLGKMTVGSENVRAELLGAGLARATGTQMEITPQGRVFLANRTIVENDPRLREADTLGDRAGWT